MNNKISVFFLVPLFVLGCSSTPPVVPESLEPQVEKNLTYSQVADDPEAYRGKLIVVGGQVLSAKRLKTGTQIEILELPLKSSHRPTQQLTESNGRFLALQQEFLDPAQLPAGTMITVVGKVTGSTTQLLDEAQYRYPTMDIEHLHVWEPDPYGQGVGSGPRWSIFGGGGSGGRVGGGVGVGIGF